MTKNAHTNMQLIEQEVEDGGKFSKLDLSAFCYD